MLENRRGEMGNLPGSLGSQELSPHQDMRARGVFSKLKTFVRIYRLMKGIIFRRDGISLDQLAARNIVDDLFAEALNTREFGSPEA